jgi:hypothetical protein
MFPVENPDLFPFAHEVMHSCGIELLQPAFKRYLNDPRYVDVWIDYITYVENVEEAVRTFRDLMRKGVGRTVANFYDVS